MALQDKLGLGLAQAQTANMNAQAYNTANASDPGRVQISGGNAVGSTGTYTPTATPTSTPSSQSRSTSTPQAQVQPIAPAPQKMSAGILPAPVKAPIANSTAGVNPITGTPNELVNSFKPKTQNISTMAPPTVLGGASAFNAQSQRGLNVADRVALRNGTTPAPTSNIPSVPPQQGIQGIDDIPLVGNAMLDKEIGNLNYDKNQAVKSTIQSYALAQGDYLKNAGYYTNFQPVNEKFNGVLQDIQSIYSQGGQITDQQAQLIASRNGVTVDEVKNPANIYNQLQMTEQGKQDLGVATRENQITDLATKTEQQKQDLQTNLARNTQQLTQQIDDTQKNLERTEEWLTASGVWSGASRSSGYAKGMQNVKDDANTVISRIQDQIQYANEDATTHLGRIGDEFTKNTTRLQQSLNTDLQKINQTMGVQLNGLSDQYGMGSPKLTRALDDIAKNFGSQYMDLYSKYQQQQKNAIALTMDNLNVVDKMNTLNNAMSNKRYNELLANNGAILSGTSLASIANEVKAGTMDPQKYQDIKAIMLNSVMTNLAETKQVTQDDYNVVAHMLDSGSTPAQIVATLSGQGKASRQVVGQHYDDNTGTMVNDYAMVDQFGNAVQQGGTMNGTTGDLRGLASQFPGQAWAKNNNPAGITWNANFDNPKPGSTAQRLIDAGVQFSRGTPRPGNEGGNYVTFNTIEDGLKAQRIMMQGTYGNSTVGNMLASWVGTSEWPNYARQVAGMAGIDPSIKVSDLSEDQLSQLQMAKIKKESPGLGKLLSQPNSQGNLESVMNPTSEFTRPGVQIGSGQPQYSDTQKNILSRMDLKTITAMDEKILRQNSLTTADLYNYQAQPTTVAKWNAPQNVSLYRTYVEEWKLPSKDALAGMGMTSQQFMDNADSGYDAFLQTKAKEISDTYPTLDLQYTGNYAGQSATQKEKLNESVAKIGDIDSRITQLKDLFAKNGTEVWPTKDKWVMESLRKQIILKAKEVENLGVLNGPDLGILEDLLPGTTGLMSGLFSLDENTMAKLENIQNNYRNDAKTKAINYGAKLNFWDKSQETPQQPQSTTPSSNDPFGIR